jgi:hypothetical protein
MEEILQLKGGLSMIIHVYPNIQRVSTIQGGAGFLPVHSIMKSCNISINLWQT